MQIECVNIELFLHLSRPQTKGREEVERETGEVWPPSEMIQILIQENSALKLELERCYNKVAKSQKLEQEITKVHRAHEDLAASCERREKLERAARSRLQNDCKRLIELNRALRDQIDLLSARTDSPSIVDSIRKELSQRELLIGQLITQSMICLYCKILRRVIREILAICVLGILIFIITSEKRIQMLKSRAAKHPKWKFEK